MAAYPCQGVRRKTCGELTVAREAKWVLEELCSDDDLDLHVCGVDVWHFPTHHESCVLLAAPVFILPCQSVTCLYCRVSL